MQQGTLSKKVPGMSIILNPIAGNDFDGSRIDKVHVISLIAFVVDEVSFGEVPLFHVFGE
jgi:hypothetical protein